MNLQEYLKLKSGILNIPYYDREYSCELAFNTNNDFKLSVQLSEINIYKRKINPGSALIIFDFIEKDDCLYLINYYQSSIYNKNKVYHYSKSADMFNMILLNITEQYFFNKKLNEKLPEKNKSKVKKI